MVLSKKIQVDDLVKYLSDTRKQRGIEQKHIVLRLGVTGTTLSRYEQGKREMPFKVLRKYAEYLGFEIKLMVK